ncbi:hypothetical protein ACFQPA_18220 [Halomarina halobia]|uniref:MarR family transcriptional regulator n=1 Tax=Halomarina halobia TaxID=3033386 RepID=A0ABD6AD86_9EURY|nr:hypothetical protein [Halomarina sp. PSR21]
MTDLTDEDCEILARLAAGERDAATLATEGGVPVDALERRLPRLVDDGLVSAVGDDRYAITRSGRRALRARGDDPSGETGDVPPRVEREIEGFDLRPDAEDAIRRAFTFLRDWREATASEIVDAAYSEDPAGWETRDGWWRELVRERLAALPDVVPPDDEGGRWRYAGEERIDEPTRDGRRMLDPPDGERYGSAKQAIEHAAGSEAQADALSAAFALVFERGSATADELATALDLEDRDEVLDLLETIPDVERVEDGTWRYVPAAGSDDGGRR